MTAISTNAAPAPLRDNIRRIIAGYDSRIIRLYVTIRFLILRQRFLAEIGQYLPENGHILDIGCGFGLFSLFYALLHPKSQLTGLDLSPLRIRHAQYAAAKLGIGNTQYSQGDAACLTLEHSYDAVYMLDIIHHVPQAVVMPMLARIRAALKENGVLIIKDVDTSPAYQRWFTWWLDKLMDWRTPVNYWPSDRLSALLKENGFQVFVHHVPDVLPYPHVLYICKKR